MKAPWPTPDRNERSEQGAALVLAIVFLVAMSILVVVLGNLATEASTATSNVRDQTTIENNAESAATFAIQQERRSYLPALYTVPATPQDCLPGQALSGPLADSPYKISFTVWCRGSQSGPSRTVDFYVCTPTATASQCTSAGSKSVLLFASVTYDDSPGGALPLSFCGPLSNATCGVTLNITEWDVRTADS